MSKVKCAVFDLDGTLINTITDLGNACNYVIKKHNFSASWSEDDYKKFVGNGMRKLVERAFDHSLSKAELEVCLKEFMEYYNKTYLDNTRPYDGIKEQLQLLKDKGIKLAVVTNKAEKAAKEIVEFLFGEGTFDVIIGQREGLPTKPDPEGVFIALKELNCTPDEAIYFGDSNVDMQTAKNANIRAVAVTWGFRSYEELAELSPYKIINNPTQIIELF